MTETMSTIELAIRNLRYAQRQVTEGESPIGHLLGVKSTIDRAIKEAEQEAKAPIEQLANVSPQARTIALALEWSATAHGQGSSYMGSESDGRAYGACPVCRGINPNDSGAKGEFQPEALGHKKTCIIARLLVTPHVKLEE